MKNRSELRDIIVKVLYQIYIYRNINEDCNIDSIIKENLETENEFVKVCVNGVIENEKELETLANKYLKNWDINRLSKVDKAILLLGVYELMYTDTPNIVCINEAIILAKKYSDDDVVKMINATLDSIYKNEVEE